MKKPLVVLLAYCIFLQACIVRAPKYTRVEKVMRLKTGMHLAEVDSILSLHPYSIKSMDTTGHRILLYKFRTEDRKTLSFTLKDTNGRDTRGPFMDLLAYFDGRDVLYRIETAEATTEVREKKLDVDKLVTLITVTIPAVAVAIGLSKTDQ